MQTRGKNTWALKCWSSTTIDVEVEEVLEILGDCYPDQAFSDAFVKELTWKINDRRYFTVSPPLLWRDVERSVKKASSAAAKLLDAIHEIDQINDRKGLQLLNLIERDFAEIPYRFLVLMKQDLRERYFLKFTPARGNRSWVRQLRDFLRSHSISTTYSGSSGFYNLLHRLQTEYEIITPDKETYVADAFYETVRKWLR